MVKITDIQHKNLNNKTGIYIIHCKNHKYVGSSNNIYYRLKRHLSELKRDIHFNKFLQNCWNKYGIDNFYYEVLELCNQEILRVREKHYIDLVKPDTNNEIDPVDRIFKLESVDKIRKTLIKKYKDGTIISKSKKKVFRFSLEGVFIDSFPSAKEASISLGLSHKKICKAACYNGHSQGFLWSYDEQRGLPRRPVGQCKKVFGFNKEGEIVNTWYSLIEAAKSTDKTPKMLSYYIRRNQFIGEVRYSYTGSTIKIPLNGEHPQVDNPVLN